MKPHIALIGLRASGKSTLGRILATQLARPFADLDDELARQHALESHTPLMLAGDLLRTLGEPSFRAVESRTLERLLASDEPLVLATGGGAVEIAANRERLRLRATCVWLTVPLDELSRRLRADHTPRPPLLGHDALEEMAAVAARRAPLYRELADLTLDGRPEPADRLAQQVLKALGLPDGGSVAD